MLLAATVGLIPFVAGVSPAQATSPEDATPGATSESGGLAEVIVTAQRRKESLFNVPISVSAYDRAKLDDIGARDVEDIAQTMPGIIVRPGFEGTTSISIRGISSVVGSGTTGIYIDDTPLQVRALGAGGVSTSAFPRIFDLERVEVLRGPQGTLFGSGSEGGTIRFITPAPALARAELYARSEIATTENGDPSYELGVAGGAPLVIDKVGFRVSAYGRRDGGWIDRAPYPADIVTSRNINSETTGVFNAALAFKPVVALTVTPAFYYQRESRQDISQYWPQLSDPAGGRLVSGQLLAQPGTDAFSLPSLRMQWDTPTVTIYSNTSYLHRSDDVTADYSFIDTEVLSGNYANPAVPSPTVFLSPQRVLTQEIRIQSNDMRNGISWLIGGFYQNARQGAVQIVRAPGLGQVTQALFGLPVVQTFGVDLYQGSVAYQGVDYSTDQQTALFANANWPVTKALTASVGVRVARTKFNFTNAQNGPFNGGATSGAGGQSETPVSPKIGLEYKPDNGLLVYASAAKGFRTGGANTPVSATTCAADLQSLGRTVAPTSYDSDSLWSYELGTKFRSEGGRFQIDGSVFYIDWKNIQSVVPLLHCGFSYVGNLGNASSKGGDMEASLAVTKGLILHAAVGYTAATYSQTIDVAPGTPLVTNGDRLDTPPWHFSATADYTRAFSGDLSGYLHMQYDFNSGYSLQDSNDVTFDPLANRVEAIRVASVRGGLRFGNWDASLFANNVLDSYDRTSLFHDVPTSALVRYTALRPRTVGMTLSYRY